MRLSRLAWALGAASACAIGILECSSSSTPPPGGGGAGVGGGGGPVDSSVPDQYVAPVDATPPQDVTTVDGGFGGLQLIEHPDVPCVTGGGTATTLYPSASAVPMQKLVAYGASRRAAGGVDLGGFVTFNTDGTSPSATTTVGNGSIDFGSEGTTLGVGASQGANVVFRRFDTTGTPVGAELVLTGNGAPTANAVAVAGGDGQSLVVWASGGGLHAVAVDDEGGLGSKFDFAAGAYSTQINVVVAYAGSSTWGIVWTGDQVVSATHAAFAVASTSALTTGPTFITNAPFTFQAVKLVKTPSGYGLLVFSDAKVNNNVRDQVYVLLLDGSGNPTAIHRYLGANTAWDLAAQGTELGLLASWQNDGYEVEAGESTIDGAPQAYELRFRPLDATGNPIGGWVCVGANLPPTAAAVDMAIDSEGAGYATVTFDPSGNDLLTKFDHLGTGP